MPGFALAYRIIFLLRLESELERKPEVPASPRGEALFRCARPSGVPRGPAATATPVSLSCRHLHALEPVLCHRRIHHKEKPTHHS